MFKALPPPESPFPRPPLALNMVSLHIRSGRDTFNTRASLSTIFETECDTSDAPMSWEGMTSAAWSPTQITGFKETLLIPERISPHSTLHKEDPLEYGLIPFPRSDPPTDMAELLVDQICEPKREVGLRRRRRTRTVDVIEFAREQDEETEEPTDLLATIDAEEEGILLVPADYQLSLLEEELPPDECGADVLDIDTLDDESVASGTCKLTLPRKPSPPELERPRPTPPLAPRPLSSMSTASFSSLSLPSSRSSSPSPPATPSSPLPIPYQSQLPRSFHLTGPPFEQSQGIEMSWSTVPPHLMGIFMGAEKEYHRLRSIVESPSLFDEDLYDSDATIRPLTFGRSRSRAGDRRVEQLVT